jgi:hypothetical protein
LKIQKNLTMVISVEEQKRLTHVFILLIAIDKRVNPRQAKAKRVKKVKENKCGSLKCEPIFLLRYVIIVLENIFM